MSAPQPVSPAVALFLNVGHTLDHLFMLIFPTAVLAIGPAFGMDYSQLLPLSLGGFIAFGACSIPAGWLADRWSRKGMMVVFFVGMGLASVATGMATTTWQIAAGLTAIGVFGAIYHPVGIAMLVSNTPTLGRTLGVNGVYGNLGVAFSALLTGLLADSVSWRAAFIVPGVVSIAVGLAFARTGVEVARKRAAGGQMAAVPKAVMARVFAIVAVATICGGVIFNATTVSMPKVFDERLSALAQSTLGIGVLVCMVYVIAAMAQLLVGWWLDRRSLRSVFIPVIGMQVPLLLLAGSTQGWAMLAVAVAMMFFVFGQIPINDAMIARYTAEEWRSRAYAVRYVVTFGASAAAVPMIAVLHKASGDFSSLYLVLAGFALASFCASLTFPSQGAAPASAGA
jgi:MFS family permease